MALPQNLLYGNKVSALPARQYSSNIQPQGAQTYVANDTMIFNIPCNSNTCLSPMDTFLKFKIQWTNGSTNTQAFVRLAKAGAHSFIQRLRLFHASTLLEDIDNYGNLVAQLAQHQRSSDNVRFKGSVAEGFAQEIPLIDASGNQSVYALDGIRGCRIHNDNWATAPLAVSTATSIRTFAIPLVSVLGTLTDKYLPLFKMTQAPLRLEIQLVANALIPVVIPSAAAAATFTISSVELVCSFVELGDASLQLIEQSIGGGDVQLAFDRWSNVVYNQTLNTSTTNVSCPVPFKYSSVQALIASVRVQADTNGVVLRDAYASYPFSINEYWFNFGSISLPTKHPDDLMQMFNFYMSSLGSANSLNHNPYINFYQYAQIATAANTTEDGPATASTDTNGGLMGCFGIGMELVSFPSADASGMFSGRNTQTEDVYFNAIYSAQGGATNVRYDFYCLHQAVMSCGMNGTQIRF